VLPVLLLAMEVPLRGEWKGKGHVNVLFTFQSLMPGGSSCWPEAWGFFSLVATYKAIWSSILCELLERQCFLLSGLAGVKCSGKPASTCTEI